MAQCSSCGATLGAGDAFCAACGTTATPPRPLCPSCGRELKADARFCTACGQSVATEPPAGGRTVDTSPATATEPLESPTANREPARPDEPDPSGDGSRTRTLALIVVAAAVLIVLAMAALVVSEHHKSPRTPASSSASQPSVAVVSTLVGPIGTENGGGTATNIGDPYGIARDAAGNLFVTDKAACTIRKITAAGVVTTVAGQVGVQGSADGTGSAATFGDPMGITCDSTGNLYVADYDNGHIRKITPAGEVTTVAGQPGGASADGSSSMATFSDPVGIARDAGGNLYVTNDCSIRKITPAGVVTTLAGQVSVRGSADGTGAAATFDYPEGLACSASGNLYVSDGSNTIRKVTPAGVVTTVAGQAGVAGSADGTGAAATFDNPEGMACDAAGDLYVADEGNSTIRKITPAGVVTTVAVQAGAQTSIHSPSGIVIDAAGNLYVAEQIASTVCKITWSH